MQKQAVTIEFFLALQNTDSHIEFGIFDKGNCLSSTSINKRDASKNFLITLDELLKKTSLSCQTLDACIVNRGPSPFTLLRTVITYTHGLQAALKIPIAGIEGFDALAAEHGRKECDTLIIQNAFNNQLYYYHVDRLTNEIRNGCIHHAKLEETLRLAPNTPLMVLGNGYELYREQLSNFKNKHLFANDGPMPHFSSINFLGSWGYDQILSGAIELSDKTIMPLYLKNPDLFPK